MAGFLGSFLDVMGVKHDRAGSNDLNDPYSSGGTNAYRGLNPEGKDFANQMRTLLQGNPYAGFAGVRPTLQLNNIGLTEGQQGGFDEAVRQAMGKLSGNFADRGFNTPRAVSGIAGSAAQNVMPQFAPMMAQNLNDLFAQQMGNQQFGAGLEQARINQALNLLPQFQEQTQTTRGPGLGYNTANTQVSNWYDMWNKIGSSWGGGGSGSAQGSGGAFGGGGRFGGGGGGGGGGMSGMG